MSGVGFDNAAKARLANSIIGSGSSKSKASTADNDADDAAGAVNTAFKGQRTGNVEIDDADNGFIVTHRRRVDKPAPKPSGDKAVPSSDYEHHTVKRVFAANDHSGMMDHVKAVLSSPRRKGDGY